MKSPKPLAEETAKVDGFKTKLEKIKGDWDAAYKTANEEYQSMLKNYKEVQLNPYETALNAHQKAVTDGLTNYKKNVLDFLEGQVPGGCAGAK